MGWVVYNSVGSFILDGCEEVLLKWPIKVLKALTTVRVLLMPSGFCGSESFSSMLVESNCVNLIVVVNGKSLVLSEFSNFVF